MNRNHTNISITICAAILFGVIISEGQAILSEKSKALSEFETTTMYLSPAEKQARQVQEVKRIVKQEVQRFQPVVPVEQ
ncbi:hypothetical protein [uncultured Thiodictyon sp.]|uniref:hypothetical protein n=1 Tax=uncultured Thiodictyon sp. TaxID=1846217 RepID=UPI0025E9B3D4|nr:hypothetical protein [uncultured Thiodictyon sp.]